MFACTKVTSKLIKDLNEKSRSFRRKYIRVPYHLGFPKKDFLGKTQKNTNLETVSIIFYTKMEIYCLSKTPKVKKKMSQRHLSTKDLVSRIYEESL